MHINIHKILLFVTLSRTGPLPILNDWYMQKSVHNASRVSDGCQRLTTKYTLHPLRKNAWAIHDARLAPVLEAANAATIISLNIVLDNCSGHSNDQERTERIRL